MTLTPVNQLCRAIAQQSGRLPIRGTSASNYSGSLSSRSMTEEGRNHLSDQAASILLVISRRDSRQVEREASLASGSHPSPAARRQYPSEIKDRAVRMVQEHRDTCASLHQAIVLVARQLGIPPGSLRNWVRNAGIGSLSSTRSIGGDAQRIFELEREVRDLRKANQILAAASVFIVSQLEPAGVAADATRAQG
ncbi:transposase [Microbispora bryophytorum]|uniref:transposase n=1 Tax=Microbispora bryophytorum TaxID=1460882 RepID=UPI003409A52C